MAALTSGSEAPSLRFAGYAAVFGRTDRGGDSIVPGAFADTLRAARPLPLLWQHDPDQRIGTVERLAEDARGLRVIASLARGSVAGGLVASGAVRGLSFGYRVVRAAGTRPRRLITLDLVEISLVTFPMQPLARVLRIVG